LEDLLDDKGEGEQLAVTTQNMVILDRICFPAFLFLRALPGTWIEGAYIDSIRIIWGKKPYRRECLSLKKWPGMEAEKPGRV
jgi:hypothetical protein